MEEVDGAFLTMGLEVMMLSRACWEIAGLLAH